MKIPQELRQQIFDYVYNRIDVVIERVLEEGKGFDILRKENVIDQICIKIDEILEEVK